MQRKLAGYTQQQLAMRANYSAELIGQVERGVKPASPALTTAAARALRIDVETLTGQPYGAAITDPVPTTPASPRCGSRWTAPTTRTRCWPDRR